MEELTMLIKPGQELPNPGKTVQIKTVLGDATYEAKVRKILSLKWNLEGDLIVTFLATLKTRKG